MAVLPHVVDAVGDRLEVLLDGGVRSGHDIYKALALGAKGVLIGRPFLYGLAAMGERGVDSAIEVLRESFDNAMILTGVTKVGDISRDNLYKAPLKN
jgi:L-lactate dehydrogenase (cytochrome)